MNEAAAYEWTGQAIRSITNLKRGEIVEGYNKEQLADSVASAILEAYRKGRADAAHTISTRLLATGFEKATRGVKVNYINVLRESVSTNSL